MKTTIINFIFPLLILILLLTPAINLPLPISFKYLDIYVNLLLATVLFYRSIVKNKIETILLFFLLYFGVLIFYLAILELLFQIGDYTGFSLFLRSLSTIISAYVCALFLQNFYKENAFKQFGKIIFISSILQAVVIWLSFISASFRDYMSVIFYRDFNSESLHLIMLRVPGFVPTGGDGLSMNHGLLCVVGFIAMISQCKNNRVVLFFFLISVVSAIACLFTGRTGLYMSLFFIFFIISIYNKGNFSIIYLYRFFFILVSILSIFVIFANTLGSYGNELYALYGYEHPVVRFLRGFMSLSNGETDSYNDSTVTALFGDHLTFPKSGFRLFFGNNSFVGNSKDIIPSDIGYIKYIYGMGLFGIIYCLGFFVFCFIIIRKLLNKISIPNFNNNSIYYLFIIILSYGFIGHFKINYLNSRIFLFLFLTYFFILYNMKSIQKSKFLKSKVSN